MQIQDRMPGAEGHGPAAGTGMRQYTGFFHICAVMEKQVEIRISVDYN